MTYGAALFWLVVWPYAAALVLCLLFVLGLGVAWLTGVLAARRKRKGEAGHEDD